MFNVSKCETEVIHECMILFLKYIFLCNNNKMNRKSPIKAGNFRSLQHRTLEIHVYEILNCVAIKEGGSANLSLTEVILCIFL